MLWRRERLVCIMFILVCRVLNEIGKFLWRCHFCFGGVAYVLEVWRLVSITQSICFF